MVSEASLEISMVGVVSFFQKQEIGTLGTSYTFQGVGRARMPDKSQVVPWEGVALGSVKRAPTQGNCLEMQRDSQREAVWG